MIDHAIPKAPGRGARRGASPRSGRRETFGRYALVEARPPPADSTRSAVTSSTSSCPLIGDVRYGKGEHNRIFRTEHGLHRLALHATSLSVPHPDGGELRVDCALPDDLAEAIATCRLAYGIS